MGALLEVRDLSVHFTPRVRGGPPVRAVDGIDLTLERGGSLGLVGESGCGKSTVARTLLGLHRPTSGSIRFDGTELVGLSRSRWRPVRRRMQMVFQDPLASLDPRLKVGRILMEPLEVHRIGKPAQRRMRALALLEAVGLKTWHFHRYPHEFSGGQCQRIAIARALALEPEVVVCDEPMSALDVSIQAQLVNLFGELRERFGLAYLFISHDLGVVRQLCDEVAVMYLGRLVEVAARDALFEKQRHPYSRALISAIPLPDPSIEKKRERIVLTGEVPSPAHPPSGCRFHPRCAHREEVPDGRCVAEEPQLLEVSDQRSVACHLTD
jgi:oligopeptide/dipeptide ABC transporter ATP-binding protein